MMKRLLCLIPMLCIVVCCRACADQTSVEEPNKTSVNILKDAYESADCVYPWAESGSDWSYISIDTNPYDYDSSDYPSLATMYMSVATTAIKKINEKLGLPESLYETMGRTTALMGRQTKTYNSIGIEVSWTYHPDKGLNVIDEVIVA